MIYEIEFYVGNDKYEYEIDAKTGNVIEKEIDRNELFDDLDDIDDKYDNLDDKYDDLDDRYDDDDDDDDRD